MAGKKVEPVTSLGKDTDKLTVQKSKPLYALWQSELTLAEFKILDIYLSRIDSHKPDKRAVKFGKGELEKILGVKRLRNEELDEKLKHLMTTVKIEDSTKKKGFTRIALFERATAEQDDNGAWEVEMICTPSAMKYVFNIEELGYIRYKLRCITSIKSRYTYIMFIYLESNRFRKSWKVDLEELKTILNCDKEELYKTYKYFNREILKRVQKELNEKTECEFTYEPIKKGKTVVALQLTLETLSNKTLAANDLEKNQITCEEWEEYQKASNDKELELWKNTLIYSDYTKEQIAEIETILKTIPESKLPQEVTGTNDIEKRRDNYICYQIAVMNNRDSQKKINNKFAYLVKMLKTDAVPDKQVKDKSTNKFNNFEQREYTQEQLNEIERVMLNR